MNDKVFRDISKIIERDSKTTTYKFALLRGTIDIIQENSPYISIRKKEERVDIPTGLLIEKWLVYYYPIFKSEVEIPQIHRDRKPAIESPFKSIIKYYNVNGGYSAFYNDLRNNGIPKNIQDEFMALIRKLRNTITRMPMKFIGRSVNDQYYSIFKKEDEAARSNSVDLQSLIQFNGSFSIPKEYFDAFKLLGSFMSGDDAILFKWAKFSVNVSDHKLSVNDVLSKVLKNPITERDICESQRIYKGVLEDEGSLSCVWTNVNIRNYDIDHVVPFSVWKNNDLWNLLPSSSTANNRKRDKVPSPELIEERKKSILNYWDILSTKSPHRFHNELEVSLLGDREINNWKVAGIEQLKNNCSYLISNRGFEEWNG